MRKEGKKEGTEGVREGITEGRREGKGCKDMNNIGGKKDSERIVGR